jgi:hypothetical protein
MRIVNAATGGEPMLTGGIASSIHRPGEFRVGIVFAPVLAENLSRLVLEHAAESLALGPRRFLKRHPAEARPS